ncbi:MAG: hypothetical protein KF752_02925 [Pirellulaceae bacterium]|nr:hypothetical protein [Pirellulaceae bacterium]
MVTQSQYLLVCDSHLRLQGREVHTDAGDGAPGMGAGCWHFVLERLDGPERLEALDWEQNIDRDRIALLSVVRGLEALEQAARVKLVTTSRYVDRGLRFGLPNWRESDYQWESFGSFKTIRNADLWQRVDSAMQYHQIASRLLNSRTAFADTGLVQALPQRLPNSQLPDEQDLMDHLAMDEVTRSGRRAVAYRIGRDGRIATRKSNPPADRQLRRAASEPGRQAVRPQWWEMAANWIQTANGSIGSSVAALGT